MTVEDAFRGAARVLDAEGRVVGDDPNLDDDTLLGIYRDMRLARRFDERAVSLQRQGRLGTYAPLEGQEAIQVGGTYPLRESDWLVYQYREHGAVAVRGLTPAYLLYWMGHEAGTVELIDDRIAPPNITIADQLPHAAGLAWGAAYRGDDAVVVCHFGDGATSEGDFHEAVTVAGVFDLPVVFVCNNNQYAISVPRARQTASDTLAAKAEAYGVRGVRVDGTDPLACHRAVETAVERARSGGRDGGAGGRSPPAPGVDPGGDPTRPTLIEAVCYRFGPHTTADDPGTYRTDEEVDAWRAYDPLPRYEAYLRDRGLVDDDVVAAVGEAVDDRVAALIDRAEGFEPEPPSMFDHAFATTPPAVARQRAAFERLRETRGDDAFRRE